jgi:hypothetical protein
VPDPEINWAEAVPSGPSPESQASIIGVSHVPDDFDVDFLRAAIDEIFASAVAYIGPLRLRGITCAALGVLFDARLPIGREREGFPSLTSLATSIS